MRGVREHHAIGGKEYQGGMCLLHRWAEGIRENKRGKKGWEEGRRRGIIVCTSFGSEIVTGIDVLDKSLFLGWRGGTLRVILRDCA